MAIGDPPKKSKYAPLDEPGTPTDDFSFDLGDLLQFVKEFEKTLIGSKLTDYNSMMIQLKNTLSELEKEHLSKKHLYKITLDFDTANNLGSVYSSSASNPESPANKMITGRKPKDQGNISDFAKLWFKQIYEANEAAVSATEIYYDKVRFNDKNYYSYRQSLMENDAKHLKYILGEKFDDHAFFIAEQTKLDKEYYAFLSSWAAKQTSRAPADQPQLLAPVPQPPSTPVLGQLSMSWNRESLFKDFIESSRLGEVAFRELSQTVADSFSFIRVNVSSTASALEKTWSNLINSMISETIRLMSQWLLLNAIGGLFGFGGIDLGSFLGLSSPDQGTGGKFFTRFGIKKFASGGDFIVPNGYSGDSYPMLVESGERVQVTPSSRVGDEVQLLAEIKSAIIANTLDRRIVGARPVIVEPKLVLNSRELSKQLSRADQITNREGFHPL